MNATAKSASLNINFDSLSECLKLVGGKISSSKFNDPCFFAVADRFFALARRFDAKLSIYVIGQDLENPRIADAVAKWHEQGHEIGNHTFSHRQDLNLLSEDQIAEEIEKCHEILRTRTGITARGFIAPGWTYSPKVFKSLARLNYLYDTSLAPSWLLQLSQLKLKLNSTGSRDMLPTIRPDLWRLLFDNSKPRLMTELGQVARNFAEAERSIVLMPLPTVPLLRIAIWHTIAFMLPKRIYEFFLRRTINKHDAFYYLMHPMDLFDPVKDRIEIEHNLRNIERSQISIEQKLQTLERALSIISSSRTFCTMQESAETFKKQALKSYE